MTHPAELGRLAELALALLQAVDEGRAAGPFVRELAVGVLRATAPSSAPWTLAVALLEGGPLRMRRAVDLAGLVMELSERVEGKRADDASEGTG